MGKVSSRTEAHRNLEVDGVLSSEKPVQGPEETTKPRPRSLYLLHRSESMKDSTLSSMSLNIAMQSKATTVEKSSS